jgi:hypothetical protein
MLFCVLFTIPAQMSLYILEYADMRAILSNIVLN